MCLQTDFAAVCEQSTDFHFPDLGQQLLSVEKALSQANTVRAARQQQDADSTSMHSTGSGSSGSSDVQVCPFRLLNVLALHPFILPL